MVLRTESTSEATSVRSGMSGTPQLLYSAPPLTNSVVRFAIAKKAKRFPGVEMDTPQAHTFLGGSAQCLLPIELIEDLVPSHLLTQNLLIVHLNLLYAESLTCVTQRSSAESVPEVRPRRGRVSPPQTGPKGIRRAGALAQCTRASTDGRVRRLGQSLAYLGATGSTCAKMRPRNPENSVPECEQRDQVAHR